MKLHPTAFPSDRISVNNNFLQCILEKITIILICSQAPEFTGIAGKKCGIFADNKQSGFCQISCHDSVFFGTCLVSPPEVTRRGRPEGVSAANFNS